MDGALALKITVKTKTWHVHSTWEEVTTHYHHNGMVEGS
jgi:hypothetical protein